MNCFRQCSPYAPGSYNPGAPRMQTQPVAPPMTLYPNHQAFPSLPSGTATGTVQSQTPGMPMGGAIMPQATQPQPSPSFSIPPAAEQPPQTVTDTLYTPGFLKTQIGRKVRVEFLIGTTSLIDRLGTLLGVGASYILIREAETDDVLLCDIYSIKFVRFYL